MPTFFDLERRFVQRDKYDHDELVVSELTGAHLKWDEVLKHRFVVVVAPANFGKTMELLHQAIRLRNEGKSAVYVALRKVGDRRSFDLALEPGEAAAYNAWKGSSPTVPLTLLVDSLDEASASHRDGVEHLLSLVAQAIQWPTAAVNWVVSTRPAVLSVPVLQTLADQLVVPVQSIPRTPLGPVASAASGRSSNSTQQEQIAAESTSLQIFSMASLTAPQAKTYLSRRYANIDAGALLGLASERGLSGLTSSPGGLDILANARLLTHPPTSLTEVFQRVVDALLEKQRLDSRLDLLGGADPVAMAEAAKKLAAASQVCQLPNIELSDETFETPEGVLSARRIVGNLLPDRVLQHLLNTQMFVDATLNQVRVYPDEVSPYLAAQRLADLVQSPEQAAKIVKHFTWEAPTGEHGVYRQFLPLVGWLATLNRHCRAEVIQFDPQALAFFGDLRNDQIPTSDSFAALRESIVRLASHGDRLGRGMFTLTSENFWQAGHEKFNDVLNELYDEHRRHHTARNALLDIVSNARNETLRAKVLAECGNDFGQLLRRTSDLRYIVEIGRSDDLAALAGAMLDDPSTKEGVVATLMTRLGWAYLSATDIAKLVERQFALGRGGYSISHALEGGLIESASDDQLFHLSRGLVLRLARLRVRNGQRAKERSPTVDRYVEVVAETLASLLRRSPCSYPQRAAMLCLLMQQLLKNGELGVSDPAGLRSAIDGNSEVRFLLLEANVRRAGKDTDKLWTAAYGYESLYSFHQEDVDTLASPVLTKVVREFEAQQERQRRLFKPRAPVQKDRLKVSKNVRSQLLAMHDGLRDGIALNGLAWVAAWLLQTTSTSRYGEVQTEPFEREAGVKLARAVESGLRKLWRTRTPSFNEHEPRSTHHTTVAGLQGLHLDLGDGNALPRMSAREVRQAIQYGVFEINGYPKWFWPLVRSYPVAAGRELEKLVKSANAGAVSLEHAEAILASLDEAPSTIRKAIAPLAWEFVDKQPELRGNVLEKLIAVALETPGVVSKSEFEVMALASIRRAFDGSLPKDQAEAHHVRTLRKRATVWAASWLTRYPASFCKMVEKWWMKAPRKARVFFLELAARLGEDRGASLVPLSQSGTEGVLALEKLYVWTIQEVRPEDDAEHPEGELFVIDRRRDDAQSFRDALIPAIAAAKSQQAYEVLERLRTASSGHEAYYLQTVQFAMREAQFARPPVHQIKYDEFERELTADVTDTTSFAIAVHNDLLSVQYEIERGEFSLRRFFTSLAYPRTRGIGSTNLSRMALEADFQCLLASELNHFSRSRYTVVIEPHTAEANRRDVLCSKGSMFASIELKMTKGWSVDDFTDALESQLVGQYMRHRNATTGFLVVVLNEVGRTWFTQTPRKRIDFAGLLKLLRERALKLEEKNRHLYLRVVGIDATKPPDFRSVSKVATKKNLAPRQPGSTRHKTKPPNSLRKELPVKPLGANRVSAENASKPSPHPGSAPLKSPGTARKSRHS